MGSRARVVLYAESEVEAASAADRAFAEIERLEQMLSDYRPRSEIRRVQERAIPGEWVPVSEEMCEFLVRCSELSEQTGGAFAVTVGPAVGLWREAFRNGQLPPAEAIAEAARRSRPALLSIDRAGRSVRLGTAGMMIDFGGVGKGLAADAAVRVLAGLGFESCLVDLGGDLALGEPPPGEDGWIVRIETGLGRHRTVMLRNTCIATSGDAERFVEIDGARFSHIVDPRTGWALSARRAATVVHPDGATADALASAACVLGSEGIAGLEERFPAASFTLIEAGVER